MTFTWNDEEAQRLARQAMMTAIIRGTEAVRNRAIQLIMRGSKTGRVYRRRGVEHQASAPGEAPATDQGNLVGLITTNYDLPGLVGRVNSAAKYAAALELGTYKMEPRPYLRPALNDLRERIMRDVELSVARALPRGRR